MAECFRADFHLQINAPCLILVSICGLVTAKTHKCLPSCHVPGKFKSFPESYCVDPGKSSLGCKAPEQSMLISYLRPGGRGFQHRMQSMTNVWKLTPQFRRKQIDPDREGSQMQGQGEDREVSGERGRRNGQQQKEIASWHLKET